MGLSHVPSPRGHGRGGKFATDSQEALHLRAPEGRRGQQLLTAREGGGVEIWVGFTCTKVPWEGDSNPNERGTACVR